MVGNEGVGKEVDGQAERDVWCFECSVIEAARYSVVF
jgi:hypothetical protein